LTNVATQTAVEFPNGSRVDLSEEDEKKRTVPKPMIVKSSQMVNGRRMYCLTNLDKTPHKDGKLYPERQLGWSNKRKVRKG
jgi:hypothetical protein